AALRLQPRLPPPLRRGHPLAGLRRLHLNVDIVMDGLCQAIPPSCPNLTDLCLRDSGEGAVAAETQGLLSTFGDLSDAGLQALAGCGRLEHVRLLRGWGKFKRCSDVGLVFAAMAWPSLESFGVSGMEKASDATVAVLLDSCPKLRHLQVVGSARLIGQAFYRLEGPVAGAVGSATATPAAAATGSVVAEGVRNPAAAAGDTTHSGIGGGGGGSGSRRSAMAEGASLPIVPNPAATLTTINLSHSRYLTAAALSWLTASCRALEELSLSGCVVTDGHLGSILSMPRLRHLALSGCMISEEGIVDAVASIIASESPGSGFDASAASSSCILAAAAAAAAAVAFVAGPGAAATDAADFAAFTPGWPPPRRRLLNRLVLGDCAIGAPGVTALRAAGFIGPALQSIDLSSSATMNDDAVAAVVAAAPALRELRVRGCRRVTDAAVRRLAESPVQRSLMLLDVCGCGLSAAAAQLFAPPLFPSLCM
ncbi:unnamed protein product, partial [Phaeothamnion confervicola]